MSEDEKGKGEKLEDRPASASLHPPGMNSALLTGGVESYPFITGNAMTEFNRVLLLVLCEASITLFNGILPLLISGDAMIKHKLFYHLKATQR
jgi:hypothetical protein